jgi:indolepyruvate ferredoxin oxidoreductase alpha subunit
MDLRIRACHVTGSFATRANRAPAVSTRQRLSAPPEFVYERLSHPPATFKQEKLKAEVRLPAARQFIAEHRLNEVFEGAEQDVGIIVQGGLYNNVLRALQGLGLADHFGACRIPILALNVVYPLVPEEISAFCAGKRAVLVVEEGRPEFIEQDIATLLRRADLQTKLHGKDVLVQAGEYTTEVVVRGLARFLAAHVGHVETSPGARWLETLDATRARAAELLGQPLPPRPPTFCVGCPERPVFAAMKLAKREIGEPHVAADIGCHAFATFEPFSQGNSILGYGMSLASAAGVGPAMERRTLAIMGDGGFWHNGLLSGVASNLLNRGDGVLVIMSRCTSAPARRRSCHRRQKKDCARGKRGARRPDDREHAARPGREVAADGLHVQGVGNGADAEGGVHLVHGSKRASASCAPASAWTRTCARVTTPASGSPAALL